MILRLEVPYLETAVRGGTIVQWDKEVGEAVGFGERVCSIVVEEWLALRRDKRASKLSSLMSAARSAKENRYEWRQNRGSLTLDIISSEQCILREIRAEAGSRVELAQTIALVSTGGDDELDVSGVSYESQPTVRVVARPMQEEEEV